MHTSRNIAGVEPEAGNDGQQSLARGEIVRIPVPKSIADGALIRIGIVLSGGNADLANLAAIFGSRAA